MAQSENVEEKAKLEEKIKEIKVRFTLTLIATL